MKFVIVAATLVLAGCGSSRFEPEPVRRQPLIPPSPIIETMPLPPPRPMPKKCWVETETTPHAVVERRYCR